ncbi:hypothetical protein IKS86_03360 [bacterium]|nr:hypothetical protein [bacterium]
MKLMLKLLILNVLFAGVLSALPISNFPTFEYEGAYDYFILSKSLLLNTDAYSTYEPQGDTSIGVEGASDFLLETDIPKDAVIEQAFLVWFASVNDADSMMFTDNQVTLMTPDGEDHTVTASLQGNSASPQGFEFESYYKTGYYYYVYRVDVTDIIANFQYDKETGEKKSLVGEYKVSGVDDIYDCARSGKNHNYCVNASMIGGWQLILIYGSSQIARKRLYLYNGLDWSANTTLKPTTITIGNFELPEKAAVKVSFVTADGDDVKSAPESLEVRGGLTDQHLVLGDVDGSCNPLNQPFNSKFRTVNHKGEVSDCREELSFDIDTFFLQYDENIEDSIINPHVQYGTNSMDFYIKTGADIVLTNYVILSVDTRLPAFDIPEKNEKFLLTTTGEDGKVCKDTAFGYQIVVENHGQEPAELVMVSDTLRDIQTYIPGTFQIDYTGTGKCFEDYPDGGDFPLKSGIMVADKMEICQDEANCERILLRFLVKMPENSPKNASFNNTALIWDSKTGEESAYRTNQGLPVRSILAASCDAMDDAAVKAKLYTKESMTCDGSKEVPDDPEPSSDKDDTDSDTKPGDDDSGDTGKDNGSSDPADGEDEEDDAGCALIFI